MDMFGEFQNYTYNDQNPTMGYSMQLQLPGATSSGGSHGSMPDSDEFHMYLFKVKRCTKTRSHDWTECPYAHRGEKARRRDPRKFPYHAVACPEYRQFGECRRGQNCEFAHGVFEFWLHPSRYRTRVCQAGVWCSRKVCFFAHTLEQLRRETIPDCLRGGVRVRTIADGGEGVEQSGDIGDLLEEMERMKIWDVEETETETEPKRGVVDGEQYDLPDIDWVYELVN